MWFKSEELHQMVIKSYAGQGGVAKKLEMSPNGLRNGIRNKTVTIRNFERICEIINHHPSVFFEPENNIPGLVSEPEAVKIYREKDNTIKNIIEMREIEVKYLKGEINRLQEENDLKTTEIKTLRKKISDKK